MLLSILIPVYNERTVVERSLSLVLAAPLARKHGARAGDRGRLFHRRNLGDSANAWPRAEPRIRLFRHDGESGQGRGGAHGDRERQRAISAWCRTPIWNTIRRSIRKLLRPLLDGHADAVFGSRYLAGEQTRVLPFWHSMINKGLTAVSNMFSNLNVTDMETCYKVFRTDLLKSIPIRSNRFGFEPEITMKVSKRKLRVYEVPISYHGRTYEEGKKIGWKDGVKALGVILYFWLIDDLVRADLRPRPAEQPDRHAAIYELADARAASAPGRHGARNRRGTRQSDGPADGQASCATSRARRIRCICTRCAIVFCAPQA